MNKFVARLLFALLERRPPISWTVPTHMLSLFAAAVGISIIASIGNDGSFVSPMSSIRRAG